MRIIIVGCGKVGSTIAAELNSEGHRITVVDNNDEAVANLTNSYNGRNGKRSVVRHA